MKIKYLLLFLLMVAGHCLHAQSHWMWGIGGYGGSVAAMAASADDSGNIISTGCFDDSLRYVSDVFGSHYGNMFLLKTNSAGMEEWMVAGVGPQESCGSEAKADRNGNIYLGGLYGDSTIIFGNDTLYHHSGSGSDFDPFLVKFNRDGQAQWARTLKGGTDHDAVNSVGTDNYGNVYAAVRFQSPFIIAGPDTFYNPGILGFVLLKYDSLGNLLWSRSTTGSNTYVWPQSIDVNDEGDIYVTGGFAGSSVSFGNDTVHSTNNISWSMFVVKYDSGGNSLFARSFYTGNTSVIGYGIKSDGTGNCYVTGAALNGANFDLHSVPGNGQCVAFFVKLDPSGTALWANWPGGSNYTIGFDVDISHNGMICFFGGCQLAMTSTSPITLGTDVYPGDTTGPDPAFIVEYDPAGNYQCSGLLNSGGYDPFLLPYHSIACDPLHDSIYFLGNGSPGYNVPLGPDTVFSGGPNNDFLFLAEFSCGFFSSAYENAMRSDPLQVYPNPANDHIRINLPAETGNGPVEILITDGTGRIVKRYSCTAQTSVELMTTDLVCGLYMATLVSNGETIAVSRFIKTY